MALSHRKQSQILKCYVKVLVPPLKNYHYNRRNHWKWPKTHTSELHGSRHSGPHRFAWNGGSGSTSSNTWTLKTHTRDYQAGRQRNTSTNLQPVLWKGSSFTKDGKKDLCWAQEPHRASASVPDSFFSTDMTDMCLHPWKQYRHQVCRRRRGEKSSYNQPQDNNMWRQKDRACSQHNKA